MIYGKIWTVVKPTVGIPVFIAAVAIVFGASGFDPEHHMGQEIFERKRGHRSSHTDCFDADGLTRSSISTEWAGVVQFRSIFQDEHPHRQNTPELDSHRFAFFALCGCGVG